MSLKDTFGISDTPIDDSAGSEIATQFEIDRKLTNENRLTTVEDNCVHIAHEQKRLNQKTNVILMLTFLTLISTIPTSLPYLTVFGKYLLSIFGFKFI